MSSQSSGAGRRRLNLNQKQYSAEDEALNIISNEAEARLTAKRAARAEAREIRLKELEKQQNEVEVKQDNAAAKVRPQLSGSRSGSRRGSAESNDSDAKDTDLKGELRELEMKYKSAMMSSAQLDNEKQSLVYQVELLKDQLEEQNEEHTELQREFKEKCRQYDFQKRDLQSMEHELSILKQQLEIKDKLIEESGFVILTNEKGEPVIQKSSQINSSNGPTGALLVSTDIREVLRKAEGATLGTAMADINTNKSGVSSKADTHERCLVTSSSVADEVDGAVLEPVLMSEMCSGDIIRKISENPASNVVLHDVISDECMSRKHESSRVEAVSGDSGNGVYAESESRVSSDDSSFTLGEVDAGTTAQKDISGLSNDSVHTLPGSESYKDAVDNETDEVDEFFDAVSTPSPSSQTRNFDEQGVDNQKVLTDDSYEGTSVDPEIITEDDIIRVEKSHIYSSTDTERESIVVENVTETESSTDIKDENEDDSSKENVLITENITVGGDENTGNFNIQDITETVGITDINIEGITESSTDINIECITESSTDIIYQNEENNNNQDTVAEAAKNDTENANNVDILNKSENELTAVETVYSENLSRAKSLEEEPSPENKTAENDKTYEKAKTTSSDLHSENEPPCSSDLGQDDADTNHHVAIKETEEITQSAVCELQYSSSLNNPEVSDVPCTTKILNEDPEKQDDEDIVKEKEDTESEVLIDGLNTESEIMKDSEGSNLECTESQVGDPCEQTESETNTSIDVQQAVDDNDGKNEDEKDRGSSEKDTSKMIVRKESMGGSEASEGLGLDDYDLDDIDDILNTDVPSSVGVDAHSTTPSTQAELTVKEATESIDQEDRTSVKSASDKEVQNKEDTKAKDNNKKSKEKIKTSKKDGKDKSKSSVKESKDKIDKRKLKEHEGKDKTDKGKSSKKDDSQDKKTEKHKESKKEADKTEAAAGGEEDKHNLDESQISTAPDDLEGALEKQMLESGKGKPHKKSSKKLSIFKKVFK